MITNYLYLLRYSIGLLNFADYNLRRLHQNFGLIEYQ